MEDFEDLDAIASRQLGLQLLSVLGRDSFSRVLLACQASNQWQVAVKLFHEDGSSFFGTRHMKREASIMQLSQHHAAAEAPEHQRAAGGGLGQPTPLPGVGAGGQ